MTARNTTELFEARREQAQDLEQAAHSTRPTPNNKIFTSTLVMALNARKGANPPTTINGFTDNHEINFERLESVARYVNTPSVAKEGVPPFVDDDGNESVIAKVCAAFWLSSMVLISVIGCLDRCPRSSLPEHNIKPLNFSSR